MNEQIKENEYENKLIPNNNINENNIFFSKNEYYTHNDNNINNERNNINIDNKRINVDKKKNDKNENLFEELKEMRNRKRTKPVLLDLDSL